MIQTHSIQLQLIMNFDIGGPSNFSSSSSDDDEKQFLANLEENESEQDAIIAQHMNIQRAMS